MRAEWGFRQHVQKDPKKELYSGMSKASVLGHSILKDVDVHVEVSQILLLVVLLCLGLGSSNA